jgi:hypothetical protein
VRVNPANPAATTRDAEGDGKAGVPGSKRAKVEDKQGTNILCSYL